MAEATNSVTSAAQNGWAGTLTNATPIYEAT